MSLERLAILLLVWITLMWGKHRMIKHFALEKLNRDDGGFQQATDVEVRRYYAREILQTTMYLRRSLLLETIRNGAMMGLASESNATMSATGFLLWLPLDLNVSKDILQKEEAALHFLNQTP